jgi:hypothetical protein
VCAYALALAPFEVRPLAAFPAAGSLGLLVVAAVMRWSDLVPWALAFALAAYAAGLLARGEGFDPLAPAYAAGLLLAAECAYWSLESRTTPETAATLLRRVAIVLGLALGTAAAGSVLLVAAQVRPPGGPLVLGAGVAAAVAAFVLLARFAQPSPR